MGVLTICLISSSCTTTSVLIQQDDDAFFKAQNRLEHTEKLVNQLNPLDIEKSIFLQAEGFYQYRFTPPKKSTQRYLAEAASAITDFPGFQSLAGSLDMEDLRFRAPDSAVQLWETLLEQHPDTTLKPLTLYRLGWAYRNVGAQGLPRSLPNDAFNELIQKEPDSKLALLAIEAKKVPYKTKEDAGFYSLMPGMGQVYLDETQSGVSRMAVAVASLIAIVVPAYNALQGKHTSIASAALGLGGLITLSFDFTNSYEDAIHGVVRWNEKREHDFQLKHPTAP
jgi:hypothetical protein